MNHVHVVGELSILRASFVLTSLLWGAAQLTGLCLMVELSESASVSSFCERMACFDSAPGVVSFDFRFVLVRFVT